MKKIKCSLGRLSEIVNDGSPYVIYINRETSWVEISDSWPEECEELIPTPYVDFLYSQNQALGDYIWENDLVIPKGMSARGYLRRTGQLYDFYEYHNTILDEKMLDWCKENQIIIEFVA